MRFKKSIFAGLAILSLVGLLNLTGNSAVMAEPLEDAEELAATGTAEGHLAAAKVYQREVEELDAKAAEFETAASKVRPFMDKLRTATEANRAEAKEMQELIAAHLREANLLHGKVISVRAQ
ncbi:MAG TPA: hypothetical protein VJU02_08375 [Nitrospiraceae bacterium]|nr:hypothetical protein [Nitrospiraceae bacterium]